MTKLENVLKYKYAVLSMLEEIQDRASNTQTTRIPETASKMRWACVVQNKCESEAGTYEKMYSKLCSTVPLKQRDANSAM